MWLSSVGKDYFSDKLRIAHHRLEAEFFANEFSWTRTRGRQSAQVDIIANAAVLVMLTFCWAQSISRNYLSSNQPCLPLIEG